MLKLTRDEMREVDRRAIEELGVPRVVLMENAARSVAEHCDRESYTVVCGGGNNGGDGYAVARHLHNRGVAVRLLAAKPIDDLTGDARIMADICQRMHLPTEPATPHAIGSDPVIDAFFGTGLTKPPRPAAAALIDAINAAEHVLSIDVPSGLDCDTGRPPGACVNAAITVTLAAPKIGQPSDHCGDLRIGDIGVDVAELHRISDYHR